MIFISIKTHFCFLVDKFSGLLGCIVDDAHFGIVTYFHLFGRLGWMGVLLDKKQYLFEGGKVSLIKFQLRLDGSLQRFLMLLTTGIKIDPCQYPGSKYTIQNNKLINSLTNYSGDRVLLTTGTKLKLVEQLLMSAALKFIYFLKIRNPVTDQSIVIIELISSYKVFYLHVNVWMKYTCTRAQLALNAVYTYYAR